MVFIETSIFSKLLSKYMKDEEYRLFQLYIMDNPDKGDIIKGSGGVRKIRWAINNKGKSGGIRIIYYWKEQASETWLLTLYAKNEKDSIPAHILKQIAQEIQND
jgi:hypothetical protein